MTKEDAYNLVNARYTLCRKRKRKEKLVNFGDFCGWTLLLNGGVILLNAAFMYNNGTNLYEIYPEMINTCHVAATGGAILFSNASNCNNKSVSRELYDEILTLESLNTEIVNGTNRFRYVEIEDFDDSFKELVKTNSNCK